MVMGKSGTLRPYFEALSDAVDKPAASGPSGSGESLQPRVGSRKPSRFLGQVIH
jgi:hypothetical protein